MNKILIPRASDNSLIECIEDIPETEGVSLSVTIYLLGHSQAIDANPENLKENEQIEVIRKTNGLLIHHINITIGKVSVRYFKGGEKEPKSAYTDELIFSETTSSVKTLDYNEKISVVQHFIDRLNKFNEQQPPPLSKEQEEQAASHSAILNRLEGVSTRLMEEGHTYRRSVDDEFSERENKRLDDFNQRRDELEKDFDEKNRKLEEEKNKLNDLRKELDDKNNTHARRQIRKDILKEIKSRQNEFSLTEGTRNMRTPIMIAMAILVGIFGIFTILSAINLYNLSSPEQIDLNKLIIGLVKQILFSAGTVGSIVFFIRWQNRWSEHHSSAEFQLKQFELDMERASWLVETSLEWKDAKGTSIPPELLNSLSKNLFSHKDADFDPLVHPADQLASALLGSASAIKMQAGNTSIDIDPKRLSKAKTPEVSKASEPTK